VTISFSRRTQFHGDSSFPRNEFPLKYPFLFYYAFAITIFSNNKLVFPVLQHFWATLNA